jgi:hypothetical protein
MPSFDAIAGATVAKAAHLEPAFEHADQIKEASKRLAARSARTS